MKEIEAMLKESRKELDKVDVPEELESRLRAALNKRKKRKPFGLAAAAAALIFLLFFGYNFDAIAYYSRQLLGFESIMSGTLQDLNELGKGQVIDKSFTLDNGVVFTLDGIMVDDNQLIAFVTQENPRPMEFEGMPWLELDGLFRRYHFGGGTGKIDEDRMTIKYIYDFEPPGPLERNLALTLQYEMDGITHSGTIRFKLDRNRAMGFTIKEKINRTITLEDGGKINLDSITVSPTMTAVDGTMDLPDHRIADGGGLYHFMGFDLELRLFADNREVSIQGSSIGGSSSGEYTFTMRYDTLPAETSSIEIVLSGLTDRKELNRVVELDPGEQDMTLDLEGNEVAIKNLQVSESRTVLTVLTGFKNPLIEEALLSSGGIWSPLIGIEGGDLYTESEEAEDQDMKAEWKLIFEGLPPGDRYTLVIQTINYIRDYQEAVVIPVSP